MKAVVYCPPISNQKDEILNMLQLIYYKYATSLIERKKKEKIIYYEIDLNFKVHG